MKTAKEIMTKEVFTVTPDMAIGKLAALFTEKRVGGFPVIEGGKLVGVVTETDLIHQNERLHIPTMVTIFDAVLMLGSSKKVEDELKKMTATTVGEIMTRNPAAVSPDTSLTELADLMGDKDAHTIPVVDDNGKVVGIVGKLDMIRSMGK